MKGLWISIVVAIVLIVGGVAVYLASQQNDTQKSTDSASVEESASDPNAVDDEEALKSVSITITVADDGFDKETYSIKAGDKVLVKNNSAASVQFSSDDHPTHLKHQELNMEVLLPGESGTFVVETSGTYGFHDHLKDQNTGTLVVE